MGKRARKTRWRALDIADDHSDSEESNTNSSAVSSRYSSHHSTSNGYYSRYSYNSSQSTPARRRYNQYDGSTKSTRSSSTTSENKITFNEDEYTRITTPRQDVLFKKGYLNKPKSYQTQTSTGNSTISTGNSTENGTPDHQSADLDYESQFVFPNGFVDQNGICYVNSYEPYPLMLFNPPTYYQEFSNTKSKRYSTGSLSESMSPNNEEVTSSQDLSQSGGEASNSGVSDYSGGQPAVFNMVFPGYYVNDACASTDMANAHQYPPSSEPVKKLKKRRERKSSKTIPGDSSEYTDENSEEEQTEDDALNRVAVPEQNLREAATPSTKPDDENSTKPLEDADGREETLKTASENFIINDKNSEPNGTAAPQAESPKPSSSLLKPDAEEFIPRAYHAMGPPPHHIKMIPSNFMPIPLVPIGEYGAHQNFTPHPAAFIPQGIPINFIPHHLGQKMFPAPVPGFVPYPPPVLPEAKIEEINPDPDDHVNEELERESTATPSHTPVLEQNSHRKAIDIATVVSKLEAVKQQERQGQDTVVVVNSELLTQIKPAMNESKPFRGAPRSKPPHQNFKRNYYSNYRNSPSGRSGEASPQIVLNGGGGGDSSPSDSQHHYVRHSPVRGNYRNSPIRRVNNSHQPLQIVQGPLTSSEDPARDSPERLQKKNSWKSYGYHGSPKGNSPNNFQMNHQKPPFAYNGVCANGHVSFNKKYSESLIESPQSGPARIDSSSPAKSTADSLGKPPKPEQAINNAKTIINSQCQWISVSSRKKKKGKNVEDVNADTNDACTTNVTDSDALFETYDVSQLVDVVPPSRVKESSKRIEDILISIAQTETTEALVMTNVGEINMPEVSDIEKGIVVKVEEGTEVSDDINTEADEFSDVKEDTAVIVPKESCEEEEACKPKKKSKKGTQKPLMKKVLITDVFSDDVIIEPAKPPLKKVPMKKLEEIKPVIISTELDASKGQTADVEIEQPIEKKPKKKKKNKSAKKSVSTSNSTISDDSYDVLMEAATSASFAGESLGGKTNDEITLELDKLIHKGMYSSLQEKIKSIKTDAESDDFFKTIESAVTTTPGGKDNNKPAGALKLPDFNRILQSTRQFLKPNMVSVEHVNTSDFKVGSSTADAADPSAGLDLGSDPSEAPSVEDKTLYPITQAVKEWMTKTREATPEVEIFKSPATIQKEFGDNNDDDEVDLVNNDLLQSDLEDEESLDQEQPDDLLMEYWANDLPLKDCDLSKDNLACAKGKSCCDKKCRRTDDSIKQDEDESKCMRQNDEALFFSHLPPRPGQLPYRAVCCSLQ